jgi:hypothetical protein
MSEKSDFHAELVQLVSKYGLAMKERRSSLETDPIWDRTMYVLNEVCRENKEDRKYLPSLGDLIDRLSIDQIKELLDPERKALHAQHIKDLMHDIDLILADYLFNKSTVISSAAFLRAVIVLALINREIWLNEASVRSGTKGESNLLLTHGLNTIRCKAKNKINEAVGGPIDQKVDVVLPPPNWIPDGY